MEANYLVRKYLYHFAQKVGSWGLNVVEKAVLELEGAASLTVRRHCRTIGICFGRIQGKSNVNGSQD
jgi:hypothetical protein